MRSRRTTAIAVSVLATAVLVVGLVGLSLRGQGVSAASAASGYATTTPIKHVVVIFQENVSFDHYFGTYPVAANPAGEPRFEAAPGTPSVNGLTGALLTNNPNAANPQRLDRSQAVTCDQDHGYTDEQKSFDNGLMDKFVEFVSGGGCADKSIVMNYYDGNTVTGMWNYAQNFAMSDNSYNTQFGPSSPGALNLVSGQTHGATPAAVPGNVANGTVIGDPRPVLDDCSPASGTKIQMSGTNVGDLLNDKGISWGWFQGGFAPTGTTPTGQAICGSTHKNVAAATVTDYIPHHEPFQYYKSTVNQHHLSPTSTAMIGQTDQANHQYDLSSFWDAVNAGNMPAVSFLKAAAYQDGHAGYSDPLDEQHFVVDTINRLEHTPDWESTAVVIAYDDSDGWYDHQMSPIISHSSDANDALTGPGLCGTAKPGAYLDRCGYGPRLPLMLISRYARVNFVDHSVTDQSSILRFVEDNWSLGRIGDQSFDAVAGPLNNLFDFSNHGHANKLFLDPITGERNGGS